MESQKEPQEENGAIQFTTKEVDAEKDPQIEYFCGIGPWKPKFLQIFRNAKFFTFLLCIYCFVEGTIATGFVSAVLSSLERRYQLTSTQAGLIVSVFDMAVIVSVIFISYFAGKGHKPRWLGVSLLIQGLGAFIFALPEFVLGSYAGGSTGRLESCSDVRMISPDCDINDKNRYSLIFFFIGNILIGVGAAPLFTVGPACIDDFVRPKFVSIHLGVFFMWSIVGPAAGFGLGAAFLSIYVNFWEDTKLSPDDPGWVGAWWLCFLLGAVVSWLIAIPFLMFPKLLPDSHLVKAEREKLMAKKYSGKGIDHEDKNFLTKLKSFPLHVAHVFITPSWLFITAAISFSAFVVTGVTAFAPKFYETQFSLTASFSSIAAGGVGIPTGAVGVIVGSLIVYAVKSDGRTVSMINWIVSLLAMPPLLVFLVRCPTLQLAGVSVPFADGSLLEDRAGPTLSSCNMNCSCTSSIFEPVCGSDDLTYFSPCIAGCNNNTDDQQRPVFENCSCVAANLGLRQMTENISTEFLSDEQILGMSTATVGTCDNGCNSFGIFIFLSIIALFMLFILQVPNIVITIRCIAEEQRSLALGMQSFCFRIIGNVPGPIVFGVIFDLSCIYFRYDVPCMRLGNCWVYDNYQLSWSLLTMVLIGIFLDFIFSFLCWLAYPKKNAHAKEQEAITNQTPMEMTTAEVRLDDTGKANGVEKKFEEVTSQSQLIPDSESNDN